MSRKFVRRGIKLGAIVGAVFFLAQVFLRKQAPKRSDNATRTPAPPKLNHATPPTATDEAATTAEPEASAPAPKPTKASAKVKAPAKVEAAAWVDPEDGQCPPTHPVKAKLSSKIFHVPGGLAYDRTTPDRCYRDAASAEADGFRPAKR